MQAPGEGRQTQHAAHRWSYPLLADELRRWSSKPGDDQRELFRRMVFNAMVTNTDDHPRNHALLRTAGGWRLSPAYDIVPAALLSQERRDPALEVGRFGRAASLYNLVSMSEVFGLTRADAQAQIAGMLKGSRRRTTKHLEMLEGAILPASFHRTQPPGAV